MTAVVSAETEEGEEGGWWWWWMSCDQPPRSHWKGQRYNYTHQRKSRDSETEALLCSSAAAQVPRAWPKSSQAVDCIPNSQSLNNHQFPSLLGQWKLSLVSHDGGMQWKNKEPVILQHNFSIILNFYVCSRRIKLNCRQKWKEKGTLYYCPLVPACISMVSRCGWTPYSMPCPL